jgi:hypothetical protein
MVPVDPDPRSDGGPLQTRETMIMVQRCPRCGVQYTKAAMQMFETTVKAGFKINLICGNCGAAMVIDESQVSTSSQPGKADTPVAPAAAGRKWWQFWK